MPCNFCELKDKEKIDRDNLKNHILYKEVVKIEKSVLKSKNKCVQHIV